eukprot:1023039-Alexandrium_andersonii.AAC.1
MSASLVGSEMCIRDSSCAAMRGRGWTGLRSSESPWTGARCGCSSSRSVRRCRSWPDCSPASG